MFSRINNIRKCKIQDLISDASRDERSKEMVLDLIPRLFKTFQKPKSVRVFSLFGLLEDPKFFKNLQFAPNLESVNFSHFNYALNFGGSEPFLKMIKSASRRKSWPHFKSLKTHF